MMHPLPIAIADKRDALIVQQISRELGVLLDQLALIQRQILGSAAATMADTLATRPALDRSFSALRRASALTHALLPLEQPAPA
jgi:hypothetical protein